jgi:type I restriction enzyme S subunit
MLIMVVQRANEETLFKETEIGLIPKDWQVMQLGHVADLIMGQSPPSETYNTKGNGLPFLQGKAEFGDIYPLPKKWCSKPIKIAQKNDVLVSVRAPVGDVNIAPFECCIGRGLAAIRPKDGLEPLYLFYYLLTVRQRLESEGRGTTFKAIGKSVIEKFKIPVPSFMEQQKIAFILSKIQQAIQQQDKIIEATKNLKKSLMHKLFTEGTRGEEQKETEIGLIPRSWDIKNLSDVAKLTSGGTPNRRVSQYFGGTIPWVKSGELEDNTIFDTEEKITEEGLRNSSAKIFPRGTLLIAMYGATVGKTAILGIEAATNQAVCAVFPKNNILTTEFLRYYIIFARHRLLSERFGGAQPNISQTILRNIRIVIPPLTEQQEIACVLTYIDKKIEIEERRKATLQQLFKTMLNKLMTGEIRVKDIDLGVINVS